MARNLSVAMMRWQKALNCRPHVVSPVQSPLKPSSWKTFGFCEDGSLSHLHACRIRAQCFSCRNGCQLSWDSLLFYQPHHKAFFIRENLPYASGAQPMPLRHDECKSCIGGTYWNIYGDQMDSMFLLNSSWIQVYVEDAGSLGHWWFSLIKIAKTHVYYCYGELRRVCFDTRMKSSIFLIKMP